MSWLDLIPSGGDAYTYDGDIICADCGQRILKNLAKKLEKGLVDDEDLPCGPYPHGGGEADGCEFCGNGKVCSNAISVAGRKIGMPLANPLTRDGVESATSDIKDQLLAKTKYGRVLGRLLRRVWGDQLGEARPTRTRGDVWRGDNPPADLLKLCGEHHVRNTGTHKRSSRDFDGRAWCDLDHVYLFYSKDGAVDACRAGVDDEGKFTTWDAVTLPRQVVDGRQPEDILAELIDEGGWV